MKILHTVEFYEPSIGGMQEVVKQISERLVKKGHDVTVVTTKLSNRTKRNINGVKIIDFHISGNEALGMYGEIDKYKQFLLNSKFDVMTNFAAQQWATDIVLPILSKIKFKKIFVPTGFSGLYLPEFKEYFKKMKKWIMEYDMNIFLANDYRDINFVRKLGVTKLKHISNGAAKDEFLMSQKIKIKKENFQILHVGSHTGCKGHKEAIRIFKKSKITNATFLMVGNQCNGGCYKYCKLQELMFNYLPQRLFDKKKLLVKKLSRINTIFAYRNADIFLFPSNIECSPIVLFECMASKTAFLTSDVGNSREIIKWSKGGLLLPTIVDKFGYSKINFNKSIKLLELLYYHKSLRIKLANSGFLSWKRKFTWEKISTDYEKLYQKILK